MRNILDFGADPTGIHDSTAAIASAINAAKADGMYGGTIYAPAGKYSASSITLPLGYRMSLVGDGPQNTIFVPTTTTGAFIDVLGDNALLSGFGVVPAGPLPDNTYGIFVSGVFAIIDQVNMQGQGGGANNFFWVGLQMYVSYQISVTNTTMTGARVAVVRVGSPTETAMTATGTFENLNIGVGSTNPGDGIRIHCMGGLFISNSSVLGGRNGVSVVPNAGQKVFSLYMRGLVVDSCTEHGVYMWGNGGLIGDVTASDTWSSSNKGNGFVAGPGVNGLTITGGQFIGNRYSGILLSNCVNATVSDAQVWCNNYDGLGNGSSGVLVASATNRFSIRGIQSGAGGHFENTGVANHQKRGIEVIGGPSDYYIIKDNICLGNVQGGVYDGGTGTHKFVSDNLSA